MNQSILDELYQNKFISKEQKAHIEENASKKNFSLFWELRTFLYLGVTLLSTGVGIAIYKNFEYIGHGALISLIAILCAASFYYAFSHRLPYSNEKTANPSPFSDYSLLLSCLLFLSLEGYLQYQYTVFGQSYRLAVFIPSVIFFIIAYYFDHLGVLSLALTGLTAWVGISVNPLDMTNPFSKIETVTVVSVFYGIALTTAAALLNYKNIKKHFTFTIYNFAATVLFIYSLAGVFREDYRVFYFFALIGAAVFFIYYARKEQSLYFLLISVVYPYIGITYIFFKFILSGIKNDAVLWYGFLYFIVSCVMVILFFLNYKKLIGKT